MLDIVKGYLNAGLERRDFHVSIGEKALWSEFKYQQDTD